MTYIKVGDARLRHSGPTDLEKIWQDDISCGAGRGKTVHQILRASASVPAAFQPVLIDVEIDGKKFQETLVGGGAIVRLLVNQRSVDISTSGVHVLDVHGRRI